MRGLDGQYIDHESAVPAFFAMQTGAVFDEDILPFYKKRIDHLKQSFEQEKMHLTHDERHEFCASVERIHSKIEDLLADESIQNLHKEVLAYHRDFQAWVKNFDPEERKGVPKTLYMREYKKSREQQRQAENEEYNDILIPDSDEEDNAVGSSSFSSSSSSSAVGSSSSSSQEIPRHIRFYRDAAPPLGSLADVDSDMD